MELPKREFVGTAKKWIRARSDNTVNAEQLNQEKLEEQENLLQENFDNLIRSMTTRIEVSRIATRSNTNKSTNNFLVFTNRNCYSFLFFHSIKFAGISIAYFVVYAFCEYIKQNKKYQVIPFKFSCVYINNI